MPPPPMRQRSACGTPGVLRAPRAQGCGASRPEAGEPAAGLGRGHQQDQDRRLWPGQEGAGERHGDCVRDAAVRERPQPCACVSASPCCACAASMAAVPVPGVLTACLRVQVAPEVIQVGTCTGLSHPCPRGSALPRMAGSRHGCRLLMAQHPPATAASSSSRACSSFSHSCLGSASGTARRWSCLRHSAMPCRCAGPAGHDLLARRRPLVCRRRALHPAGRLPPLL